MVPEKVRTQGGSRYEVTVLEGLSDLEQAAIAQRYERRTGRPFRCAGCLETPRVHLPQAEVGADEPAAEVVAILEDTGGPIPVCESCYKRMTDSSEAT